MKHAFHVLLLVLVGTLLLFAQSATQPATRPGGNPPAAPDAGVNPLPQSALIRILTPVAGQSTTSNAIDLRFELTNPAASSASSPNFQLQLDGADPITTTSTSYSYTGLAPGSHTVTVVLVDANGTPVNGGRAAVQFTVKNPAGTPKTSSGRRGYAPDMADYAPRELNDAIEASSVFQVDSLPALSLIGFGVLIGGVASAFKTRNR